MSVRGSVPAAALIAALAASPVGAQYMLGCNDSWLASPIFIAEPWEQNTRTWANGAIRLAVLDTMGEPACCSVHLLVISPNLRSEMPGHVECGVISAHEGELGWSDIDLHGARSSYDAVRGLLISVPVRTYVDGIDFRPGTLRVRINQQIGAVSFE
jgi:hypothetical protein